MSYYKFPSLNIWNQYYKRCGIQRCQTQDTG